MEGLFDLGDQPGGGGPDLCDSQDCGGTRGKALRNDFARLCRFLAAFKSVDG
jgi:hypothetical protein